MLPVLENFIRHVTDDQMVVNYVQIRQNNQIIDEYSRLSSKTRLNTWSVSKSFVSIGVGIAIDEGLITLDEKICDSFADYIPAQASRNLLDLTVQDLLTMATGLEKPLFFADDSDRYVTKDWILHFFQSSFIKRPGEQFLYSNFNTYMLSCLVERKAGKNLLEYLRHRLFEPLEINSPDWTFCPRGHIHAANGLYITIDEMGNFGEMLLNNGQYKGRSIVSSKYIRQATRNHIATNAINSPKNGYGYQFWINPDQRSYRADGKFGQYIIVLPDKNAVIAVQSLDNANIFDHVWREIAEQLE